jgi:DNA-binding transcriptional LysR family regulator
VVKYRATSPARFSPIRETVRSSIVPLPANEVCASVSIELKHLRYAEVAERSGSFRRAADSLALKQSNLSRRVRYLEEQLGIMLFERSNGGVRATSAGRDFVNGVRRVLNDLQIVVDGAKAAGRGEAGCLKIGFYTSLSAGNLRASLVEYGRRFPQVEISTVESSRTRLFDEIQNGTIDIAVVTGEPASDGNRSMVLWSERIIVALPEDHPLAANEIIYWKLASPGDLPDVVRHDVSPESIKSLVGAGRGVSLMCEACMGASFAGVVYREARDGNGSTRVGYRAYWRDGNENPALRNFIRLLEERCPPVANGNGPRGASSRTSDPSPHE